MMQLYEGGGERGRIVNWIQFCEPNGRECPQTSYSMDLTQLWKKGAPSATSLSPP